MDAINISDQSLNILNLISNVLGRVCVQPVVEPKSSGALLLEAAAKVLGNRYQTSLRTELSLKSQTDWLHSQVEIRFSFQINMVDYKITFLHYFSKIFPQTEFNFSPESFLPRSTPTRVRWTQP
jgi:hypothetical protein